MPKQKSHSGLKKRVKVTGTGKFKVEKTAKRHLLQNKSATAKGRNRYGAILSPADSKKIQSKIQG